MALAPLWISPRQPTLERYAHLKGIVAGRQGEGIIPAHTQMIGGIL